MKLQKLISSLLLAAMLVSMAACGGTQPGDDTTNSGDTTPAADTTLSEEDERLAIDDGLPEKDFEGYEFTILTHKPKRFIVEGETGAVLDDAKWKRQMLVEDRFNVKLVLAKNGTYQENHDAFVSSVLSGDKAYDLFIPHQINSAPSLVNDHLVADWNDVPYINLEQPWWNQRINETLNLAGHQFYMTGFITLPAPKCMFFNKDFVEDYQFEDLYAVVREGRWTIDYMMGLTRQVGQDVNNDAKLDGKDILGIGFNDDNDTVNWMYAFNHLSVVVDKNGEPTTNINNEKMISIIEKIYDLAYGDNGAYVGGYTPFKENVVPAFEEGRCFIRTGAVSAASSFRDYRFEFGVIPYPKWDEAQDGYYCHVDGDNGMLCIPVDAEDLERTGVIVEAFAAETYKHVMSPYYESSLGEKYFRDAESVEMMDIIFDGIIYDFGYIYDHWNGCTWTLPQMIKDKTTDLTSYWAGVEYSVEAAYDELFKAAASYGEE